MQAEIGRVSHPVSPPPGNCLSPFPADLHEIAGRAWHLVCVPSDSARGEGHTASIASVPDSGPGGADEIGWQTARGAVGDEVVLADGWLGSLSGEPELGRVYARSGNVIRGWHVFGQVIDSLPSQVMGIDELFPQYVLFTEANLLDPSECERITSQPGAVITPIQLPGEEVQRCFTQSRVDRIRKLPILIPDRPRKVNETYGLDDFETARRVLESLAPGTELWDVYLALDAQWMTGVPWGAGRGYTVYMDGYANWTRDPKWRFATDVALYEVWPLGFVENGAQREELLVIFENGNFLQVIPWVTREELTNRLRDRALGPVEGKDKDEGSVP